MELKEAQRIFNELKDSKTFNQMNHLGLGFVANAGVILNSRITKLEAEVKRLEGQLLELNTLISDVY